MNAFPGFCVAERDQHGMGPRALFCFRAPGPREAEIVLDEILRKLGHRHLLLPPSQRWPKRDVPAEPSAAPGRAKGGAG
jgi:hypothetical protein